MISASICLGSPLATLLCMVASELPLETFLSRYKKSWPYAYNVLSVCPCLKMCMWSCMHESDACVLWMCRWMYVASRWVCNLIRNMSKFSLRPMWIYNRDAGSLQNTKRLITDRVLHIILHWFWHIRTITMKFNLCLNVSISIQK